MRFPKIIAVSLLTLSLIACSTEGSNPSNSSNNTHVDVASAAIKITDELENVLAFNEPPASIASLSPGDLDILLKLGANVTGRPSISTEMTDTVAAIPEIGNPHEPVFERIVSVHPEVLIVPPSFTQYAANIEKTGTKILYSNPESIEAIQQSITMYGELFQKQADASQINDDITAKLNEKVENTNVDALLVYGAPGTYLVALNNSLPADILNKAGGHNIASDFPATDQYPSYATLSIEKIIARNPQVIMLITHANAEAVQAGFEKQMSESAAWKNLDAVKNNKIIVLPAELFGNNPGTKITEALDFMIQTLQDTQ